SWTAGVSRQDRKWGRYGGVSPHLRAGAAGRNPERSRRIPRTMVRKGGLEPPRFYPPDPKLSRYGGVSPQLRAGAARRNPERSRKIPETMVGKGGSEPTAVHARAKV